MEAIVPSGVARRKRGCDHSGFRVDHRQPLPNSRKPPGRLAEARRERPTKTRPCSIYRVECWSL